MEERIDPIEETDLLVEETAPASAETPTETSSEVSAETTTEIPTESAPVEEVPLVEETGDPAPTEDPRVDPPSAVEEISEAPATDETPVPAEQTVTETEIPVRTAEPSVDAEPTAVPTPDPAPTPGYGAPQMLYEDFIPYDYLHETTSAGGGQTDPAPVPDPAPSAETEERGRKKKRRSSSEDELLAAVEAEMASRDADSSAQAAQTDPQPAPQTPSVAPTQTPASRSDTVVAPVAPTGTGRQEASMAERPTGNAPQTREYTKHEKKLRRKYRLDKDILLGNNDLIPGFILAKGENVVRCYHCLDSRKGDGTICLTNKRLLINADERSEVSVQDVAGIKFAKNTYFSFFKFLFALIFLGLGAFMIMLPFFHTGMNIPFITGGSWKSWFFYLFIACGAVSVLISLPLWAKMVKRSFYFSIYVRDSAPFLECKSASVVKAEKKGTQYTFVLSDAGKESEKAARELGALLIEVKEGRYNF